MNPQAPMVSLHKPTSFTHKPSLFNTHKRRDNREEGDGSLHYLIKKEELSSYNHGVDEEEEGASPRVGEEISSFYT